jgi:hypothetical protein
VIAFVCFGLYFSWTAFHTRTFGYASLADLQKEFSGIAVPAESQLSGEVRISSKVTVQAVYANYLARMSEEEISRHYESQLSSKGWKRAERDSRSTTFCKADIDAVLEIIEETPLGVRYYFGLNKEDGPGKRTGCQVGSTR